MRKKESDRSKVRNDVAIHLKALRIMLLKSSTSTMALYGLVCKL